MEKGNVLVVGYAGVGKTTLIKAVLGEKAEKKAAGTGKTSKTCKDFQIYENPGISFRLIDTVGIEPGVFTEHKAVNAVKKWCGESIKNTDDDIDRISAIIPKNADQKDILDVILKAFTKKAMAL